MLKSPEQYLSNLSFSAPYSDDGHKELNAGERAFVEKYLGMDALEKLPELEPTPVLKPIPAPPPPKYAPVLEPEIVVAKVQPKVVVIEESTSPQIIEKQKIVEANVAVIAAPQQQIVVAEPKIAEKVKVKETEVSASAASKELSLRERLRSEAEIQVVSFFVAGQLFLLPVQGIQEVLRHMELVKVPQAPDFVAGVINLRGRVTPLVYLSALLTNEPTHVYNERSFIIISGSESLQIGMIIDKVNSMHMLPQKKIIWNAESKLGEAAEFLCAIADLDDKVCGIVAPEAIVQKILPDLT